MSRCLWRVWTNAGVAIEGFATDISFILSFTSVSCFSKTSISSERDSNLKPPEDKSGVVSLSLEINYLSEIVFIPNRNLIMLILIPVSCRDTKCGRICSNFTERYQLRIYFVLEKPCFPT